MIKQIVILVATFAILVTVLPAEAQEVGKAYRIGYLSAGTAKSMRPRMDAFRQGLKALGYVEGQNVVIEERYAAGQRKRIPALAAELVGLNVNVMVTNGATATKAADRAAGQADKTIPVVFALAPDPVGAGLVASLARPSGNITGLSNSNSILVLKRLAMLKEAVPSATRIAVLWSPLAKSGPRQLKALQARAPALGVTIIPVAFAKPNDFERATSAIRQERPDALNVLGWSQITRFRKQIAAFAIENRLPTIFTNKRFTTAGGLMSYGADLPDLYRRAATYVDKILKGAKPADLPVERPKKFDFVINLKTAKALGITFPRTILLRADKVIE